MNPATSIYLDWLRFAAASVIFVVHANYAKFTDSLPFLWRFSGLGNDAVMVFFVLSGFVIAYVADQKERSLKDYVASRLARLYSVAAPALLLTVVLDYVGSAANPASYGEYVFNAAGAVFRFLSNLFFINELWFSSIRPFSNGPFWSLGYEFWYYAVFGAAIYFKSPTKYILAAVLCLLIGPKIILLFPVWLLGVWAYFGTRTTTVPEPVGWLLVVCTAGAYVVFRQFECPQALLEWTIDHLGRPLVVKLGWSKHFLSSYIVGALVAFHLIGIASVSKRLSPVLASTSLTSRYLAGYTFAIYLFHYPLLEFFAAISGRFEPFPKPFFVLFFTVLAIWLLGGITERRKSDVKRWILSAWDAISRRLVRI